jgi:hypothetical protein
MKKIILLGIVLLQGFVGFAQNTPQSGTPARKALDLYEKKDYRGAAAEYAALYQRFPKEASYNYYYGMSLLLSNQNLEKSAECLQFASLQGFPEAGFYMAQAYFFSYHFEKAMDAFQAYRDKSEKKDLRDKNVAYWIERTDYATRQTRDAKIPVCIAKAQVVVPDSLPSFGGSWILRPEKLRTPNDEKYDRTTYCFMPSKVSANQKVFFAGYGSLKVKGLEIFTAVSAGKDKFLPAENIGDMINSVYDEEYPYYDLANKTLYYASKGRNSIGGYDIFKTVFDPESKTWSVPENLGFPINTPYDDILYIPAPDGSQAILVSNRETEPGKWMKYVLDIKQGFKQVYLFRAEELYATSLISTETIKNEVVEKTKEVEEEDMIVADNEPVVAMVQDTDVYGYVNPQGSEVSEVAYHQYLNVALSSQVSADSLRRIIAEKKEQMLLIVDAKEKTKIQKEIAQLQLAADDFQAKADANYAKVSEMEKQMTKPADGNASNPQMEENQDNESENQADGDVEQSKVEKTDRDLEFEILSKSMYSSSKPFVNQNIPDGTFYRIQLGAFGNNVSFDRFGGIKPISYETSADGKITKFYAGWFKSYNEAVGALAKVHAAGFSDAFLVGYFNGKRMSPDQVKKLE